MKKALIIGVLFLTNWTFAQKTTEWCGTDQRIKSKIEASPEYQNVLHQSLMSAAQHSNLGNSRAQITIPIVVHIIHDNGVGNISDAQIYNAIQILNDDYQRMNADTLVTRQTIDAPFKDIAAGMDIEFKFAKIDPNGECTNGIVRVNAPELANNADDACKFSSNGGSDQWPPNRYFNIWVVNSIDNGGAAGTTLGYAYFPYGGAGPEYGILMRNDAFGVIGTAAGSDGRTLTHEMGHALGLPHIFDAGFGGANGCHTNDCTANGDYSCDTPPQTEANWSCSQTWNSCNAVPVGDAFGTDVFDQIENYMSYNSCQNMFSRDQVNIMENNVNTIDFLDTLRSAYTLTLTGVNTIESLCKADFDSDEKLICAGETISFMDFSYYNPSNWTWSIAPGTLGTDYVFVNGTSQNSPEPTVQFLKGGRYSISLVVDDGVSSVSATKTDFITVFTQPSAIAFIETFEAYSTFAATTNWMVENNQGNQAFEIDPTVGHTGMKSAQLRNYGEFGQNTDALISSPIDLSGIDQATGTITMSFRYAYRKKLESNVERLKVFVSNDCGVTWAQRKTLTGNLLSPLVVSTPWSPQSTSDWTTVHVTNITSAYFVENFQCKFEFEGSGGNNLYIDNINIYEGAPSDEIVGIEPVEGTIGAMSLYPNPADNELNIRFELNLAESGDVEITDVTGKRLFQTSINANSGSNIVVVDTKSLSDGTYFVKLSFGGITRIKQVVIR